MTIHPQHNFTWRKSSFSAPNGGACVEIAHVGAGGVLVRNSNNLSLGTMPFTKPELAAFIAGCKAGEFDDLA